MSRSAFLTRATDAYLTATAFPSLKKVRLNGGGRFVAATWSQQATLEGRKADYVTNYGWNKGVYIVNVLRYVNRVLLTIFILFLLLK